MIGNKRVLAYVPARGGSKQVPGKNIRPLGGIPLLCHTLAQARSVPELDLTVVSTDDPRIRDVALAQGVVVVDRPAHLAADDSTTESGVLHALEFLEADGGERFDYVVVLEPTSPLRTPQTISRAIADIAQSGAPSLIPVLESTDHIGLIDDDGNFQPFFPGSPRRRQLRRTFYTECSTIYIATVTHLVSTGSFVAERWRAFVVPPKEAVDINSEIDFIVAEALLEHRDSSP